MKLIIKYLLPLLPVMMSWIPATDVAGEMDALTDTFRDCKTCHKACTAAVEMLEVRVTSAFSTFLLWQEF